jgi:hypothetical protein
MMAFSLSRSAASWPLMSGFPMSMRILMITTYFTRMWIVTRLPASSGTTR